MNKKYDPVTVIGVAVSILALIAIIKFRPGMPQQSQAPVPENTQVVENAQQPQATTDAPAAQVADAAPATRQQQAEATAATPASAPVIATAIVSDVTAPRQKGTSGECKLQSNGKMAPSVNLDGNGFVGIELPEYKIDVVRKGAEQPANVVIASSDYPFMAITAEWLTKYGFGPAQRVQDGNDDASITLVRKSADGQLELKECWAVVNEDKYALAYTVSINNLGTSAVALSESFIEGGAMPASVTPARKAGRGESAGGLTLGSTTGKPTSLFTRDLAKMKDTRRQEIETTPLKWTAVHSKYFLLSLWLKDDVNSFAGAEVTGVPEAPTGEPAALTGPRYHVRAKLAPVMLEPGKTQTWNVLGYAGPKKFSALKEFGMGLEAVMDMDRFFFWRPKLMSLLSECLLKGLVWLSEVFPKNIGYGLGVIILTIIVKLIFWPLSHKSTKSMRKMAALKPQLDELKAKYKDDPQTMYRKQQELFKQNDVSQLGGCLPLLLQIPVFFALFNTFRNAIELRHASFLWAYDLSMPDTLSFSPDAIPIRPLALVMGGLMYYQQKLTPNPDPQQAKMMSYMSIFFILLFYGMPSALTLYLSISYLLGIVQTLVTNKMLPPPAVVATTKK